MARLFTLILFVISVGILHAMVPPTVIDANTAELAMFSREIRAMFPPAVRDLVKASCQMIAQCCPAARSQILSFSLSADKDGLMEQCFGKKESPDYREKVGACPVIPMMMKVAQEPDVIKFLSVDKSKLFFGKSLGQAVSDVCSADDVMSIVCEADKNNKLPTCQRRILENLAKVSDERVYKEKIGIMKKNGKDYLIVIKETFA